MAQSSNASTLNEAYTFTANKVGDVLDALKTAKEVVTASGGLNANVNVSQSVAEKIVKETVAAVRREL